MARAIHHGEAAETTAVLKNFYYRYCNTREDICDQLREPASQNGLTIFFEIHPDGPNKQEEYAVLGRFILQISVRSGSYIGIIPREARLLTSQNA